MLVSSGTEREASEGEQLVGVEGTTFSILPHELLREVDDPQAIRVYAFLGMWTDNNTGQAWPSRQTIADAMRITIPTVDRAAGILIDAGWLRKERRYRDDGGWATNGWTIFRTRTKQALGGSKADVVGVVKPDQVGGTKPALHKLDLFELDPRELDIAPPPRNEIWDALVNHFGDPGNVNRTLYGRVTKQLAEWGATPATILAAQDAIVDVWGKKAWTLSSLEKNYQWAITVGSVDEQEWKRKQADKRLDDLIARRDNKHRLTGGEGEPR